MRRLIINIECDIPDSEAAGLVAYVINEGRISNHNKQYCYVTTFEAKTSGDKFVVYADRTRGGSDTFRVRMR